jgi:cell division protein FtsQ
LKQPERELLGREKKRLKHSRNQNKVPSRHLSGFAVWGRVLAIGGPILLVSLVLATLFTPLLAIEQIKVAGNDRIQANKVMGALEDLVGEPLTRVTQDQVAEMLQEFTLIETFTLQAEPPHTLTVKIRERQPVVTLVRGGKNYLYDAAGVRIGAAEKGDSYPYFKLGTEPTEDPKFRTAVDVLLSLPIGNYEQIFSIEVSDQLTTVLVLEKTDIRVIWGNTQQALLKSEVLNSLIETGLDSGVTVDVSSPNAPVVTYPNY